MEIKMKKTIATFILIFNLNYIQADEFDWGEDFKDGDTISADVFNQIFNTMLNLVPFHDISSLVSLHRTSFYFNMRSAQQNITSICFS